MSGKRRARAVVKALNGDEAARAECDAARGQYDHVSALLREGEGQ